MKNMKKCGKISWLLVVGVLGVSTAAAGDWPQFHGPKRDNISTETGLLKKWPDGGPKLLWTAGEIGYGYSTVSIGGGRMYTAGNMGQQTVVTALDMDGKMLLRFNCWPAG